MCVSVKDHLFVALDRISKLVVLSARQIRYIHKLASFSMVLSKIYLIKPCSLSRWNHMDGYLTISTSNYSPSKWPFNCLRQICCQISIEEFILLINLNLAPNSPIFGCYEQGSHRALYSIAIIIIEHTINNCN